MALKGYLAFCFASLLTGVAGVTVVAARHIPTIKQNSFVGSVPVGGLTTDEASRRLRIWWEDRKRKTLALHIEGLDAKLPDETPGQLGVTLDDAASMNSLPTEDLANGVETAVGLAAPDKATFPMVFKPNGADLKPLAALIQKKLPHVHPAKAFLAAGGIERIPEEPSRALDMAALPTAVMKVLPDGDSVEVPTTVAAKHVPDDALKSITDVVTSFSTRFPASNRPRCSNIRLACSKLRGVVLAPGERFSFNGTVGRRTLRAGFKLAGVYKNGKHDVGIGGGICQVSTTLYNACLLSDLRIRQRSNHSLPVAYVPLGRDATVDYGDLDLVVENTYPTPIAIDSTYQPGRITFRILGKRDPALSVKIMRTGLRSWEMGTQTVIDRSLRPGAKKVLQRGSSGHAVSTYRLVYHDGKLVRRDYLGHNTYGGQARIIAYNPAPKPASPPPSGSPSVGGQKAASTNPRVSSLF